MAQDEVSIGDLIAHLRSQKWLILAVSVICGALAMGASQLMPRTYRASIVVNPVAEDPSSSRGGLSALASQFSGIASLAGLSVNGSGQKAESLAVLQSEKLTSEYIRSQNLLPVLFKKLWDPATSTWKTQDPEKKPTIWKGNVYFRDKVRTVNVDAKTGLVTLRIEWRDPQLAAKWANDLVDLTNDNLRQRALAEADRNIAYLRVEAGKTELLEARQAIFSLMQTEINKSMFARGSEAFALKIIDPAVPPEKPSNAPAWVWLIAGLCCGGFIALAIALARK